MRHPHPDRRPGAGVRRAGPRAAGEGARAQAGAHHRAGAGALAGPAPWTSSPPRPATGRSRCGRRSCRRHVVSITYTAAPPASRRRAGHGAVDAHHTQIQLAEWGWPPSPAVPGVHAAVARGRGLLRPDADQGRSAGGFAEVRPGRVLRTIESSGSPPHAGADHALRAAGPPDSRTRTCPACRPSITRGPRSIRPAAGGDRPVRAHLRPVLRQTEAPMAITTWPAPSTTTPG